MNNQEVEELLYLCGDEKRIFWYFKDKFCLDLIALDAERRGAKTLSVRELKQSPYKKYLDKPIFSELSKKFPKGIVNAEDFPLFYPYEQIPFVVTLGKWQASNRYSNQTTRKGANLVLQLNFDQQHTRKYVDLVKPTYDFGPFEYWGHPVYSGKYKTLAWVRLDVSFSTNEVLIEEIQTDWIRRVNSLLTMVDRRQKQNLTTLPNYKKNCLSGSFEEIRQYVAVELKPYQEIWNEAALLAAIQFVKSELGINSIYYHSFEQGNVLKNIMGKPPKSLYSTLAKRFCFSKVQHHPEMILTTQKIRKNLKKVGAPNWYYMSV